MMNWIINKCKVEKGFDFLQVLVDVHTEYTSKYGRVVRDWPLDAVSKFIDELNKAGDKQNANSNRWSL